MNKSFILTITLLSVLLLLSSCEGQNNGSELQSSMNNQSAISLETEISEESVFSEESESSYKSSAISESETSQADQINGMKIGETGISLSANITVTGYSTATIDDTEVYYIDITIVNVSGSPYSMRLYDRFHLMNSQRERIYANSLVDTDENDISALRLEDGEDITARAIFHIPEGYEVVAFTFTHDVMGFGIFTYLLE